MRFRQAGKLSAIGMAGALCIVSAAPVAGIRLNHSPSMPLGIWLARGAGPGRAYAAGDVVEACPRLIGGQAAHLGPGGCPTGREPMLKPVAAVAGDRVTVSALGVTVNGVAVPHSAPLAHDGRGRTLPPYPAGTYAVPAGHVWLLVPRPDSLDSRYLGPVPTADIIGTASPLWVWR